MRLRTGTLIHGTEIEAAGGINNGSIQLIRVDGDVFRAIVKRLPLGGIAAECLCAMLMRGWDLPVPEPILVCDGSDLLFASLKTDYPDLKRALMIDGIYPEAIKEMLIDVASKIIYSWPDAPTILAVDELIANSDRNLGNFLWSGGDEHAYIDHERALEDASPKNNHMVSYAERAGRINESMMMAMMAAKSGFSIPKPSDLVADINFSTQIDFIRGRVESLSAMILRRFNPKNDLFGSQ